MVLYNFANLIPNNIAALFYFWYSQNCVIIYFGYRSCCPVSEHPTPLEPISAEPSFYANTTFTAQKLNQICHCNDVLPPITTLLCEIHLNLILYIASHTRTHTQTLV